MPSSLIVSLQNLGLTDKSAAAYAALLGMKKGSALAVAEAAGIKRPTVYGVLESLQEKRLVAVTKFRSVKDYRALPLEHLKHYISAQKRSVAAALPTMQKLYNNRAFKTRLRIYHGAPAIKTFLEKSLRQKSVMYILGKEENFARYLGDYWQFYCKRAGQLGMSPQFKQCSNAVSLLIWKDKVAFAELKADGQVFGFLNQELHDVYMSLWKKY